MNNQEIKNIFDTLRDEKCATDVKKLISLKEREESNLALCKKRVADLRKRRSLMIISTSVAAAVVFISCLLYTTITTSKQEIVIGKKTTSTDIVLLLSDGRSVNISDETEINDETVSIKNDAENGITYTQLTDVVQMNTLIIPHGKNHKVTFEDGTVVILNSNSKLTYPTKFTGSFREVTLQGEGYFNVAKSDKMFIVKTNGINIKVFGTIFNINSYNENSIETLLLEGVVSVSRDKGDEIRLVPNELCRVTQNSISKEIVNPSKHIAWIDGVFMFEKDSLRSLIENIALWYGVEFVIEDQSLENLTITTIFSKESSLDKIISAIEMLDLKIKIENREGRYYISKK